MNETLRLVFKRLHFPVEVILTCVRWYVAYPLSLRQLEEMMAERGVAWLSIIQPSTGGRSRCCLPWLLRVVDASDR